MSAYLALRDEITIGEALEIEAALCVIGDRRESFAEWRRKNPHAAAEPSPVAGGGEPRPPTHDALRDELAHRERSLARDRALLEKHRHAVAYAAAGHPEPPGRMDVATARVLEQAIASHRSVIDHLREQLAERGED